MNDMVIAMKVVAALLLLGGSAAVLLAAWTVDRLGTPALPSRRRLPARRAPAPARELRPAA